MEAKVPIAETTQTHTTPNQTSGVHTYTVTRKGSSEDKEELNSEREQTTINSNTGSQE